MNILGEDFLQALERVRHSWRALVATDVFFKLFSLVALAPLLSACQWLTVWLAGDGLLSDVDFVLLLTQPIGLACGVLVASVWLTIIGLEQASLLAILSADDAGQRLSSFDALRFATAKAARVLKVTGLLVSYSLLVVLPVGTMVFGVYRLLLGEYDINFYLSEKPPEFLLALGVATGLLTLATAVLLWMHSGWILALPVALFERDSARESLRESNHSVQGKRWLVARWVVSWLLLALLANGLLALLGSVAGRLLIPASIGSLALLASRVGLLLLVGFALSLVINLFATVTFASLMHTGYRVLRSSGTPGWDASLQESQTGNRFALNRSRVLVLLLVGVLVACWLGARALRSLPLEDHAVVMAHRGASADAPENTMAAFQLAIDQQADWIEIDVQESADGQVIVMHDSDFMKQAGNPLKVWDSQEDQLSGIDIGSWFDDEFSDERVPTLEEVLALCHDRIGVNIELKYYGHDQRLEERVVEIVEGAGMQDQVKVMSLKKEGVAKAKALRPDWRCGLLLSLSAGDLKKLDVDFLAINASFASRSFVRRAHEAGKEVYVWTVNDAATMSRMLNRGVDGLLTDKPALARQVLSERAQMSAPERLLSELAAWFVAADQAAEP